VIHRLGCVICTWERVSWGLVEDFVEMLLAGDETAGLGHVENGWWILVLVALELSEELVLEEGRLRLFSSF